MTAGDVAHITFLTGKVAADRRSDAADEVLARLAEKAADGDLEAFDALMSQIERRVVSIAWRILGNGEDARDAAQEVFLRLYRSIGRFRKGQPVMAWVYRITVNVCHDVTRRRRRYEHRHEPIDDATAALGTASDADERVLEQQRRSLVARALETLPDRERAAFVLHDLEGLSTAEVAEALGTRSVTVRSQVSVARARIKAFCAKALEATGRRE
jgi:RNA polymerase sigma-70 factor (ECF subfamily)